jgi:hypothetical protein
MKNIRGPQPPGEEEEEGGGGVSLPPPADDGEDAEKSHGNRLPPAKAKTQTKSKALIV